MFWLVILILLGIVLYECHKKESYEIECMTFFLIVVILISVVSLFVYWQEKVENFNITPIIIDNKLIKIEEMRKTYYTPSESIVNIDTVNKDLAVTINREIIELEEYINKHNLDLAKWKVAYRYRFLFSTCFTKPNNIQPLNLKDFLQKGETHL